ncbi:hypothetical protein K0U07_03665 [bacterium]|nr:hypothetical protein [bacterium]
MDSITEVQPASAIAEAMEHVESGVTVESLQCIFEVLHPKLAKHVDEEALLGYCETMESFKAHQKREAYHFLQHVLRDLEDVASEITVLIFSNNDVELFPNYFFAFLTALEVLHFDHCPKLIKLPSLRALPDLDIVQILHCPKFQDTGDIHPKLIRKPIVYINPSAVLAPSVRRSTKLITDLAVVLLHQKYASKGIPFHKRIPYSDQPPENRRKLFDIARAYLAKQEGL